MTHLFMLWNSIYPVLYFFLLFEATFGFYQSVPHIIVIMADDLGWNDVGFHGSDQIPTPNIDALAYNGIILNRHYVLQSSTPSRTAFFTGKYPIRMGMQGEDIQGGEPRGLPLNIKILPEIYFFTCCVQNMSGYDMHRGDAPAYGLTDKYVTDLFTDEAVRIIQGHEPSRPLYLQISHLAVHAPLENPQDYDHYDKRFIHIREQNRRKYARMVSKLDDSVGRIFHALGNAGMLKNSLILFLTDNGAAPIGKFRNYGSNYPLRGMKYTLYEGGVRGVAVLWSQRLRKAARVCDDLMHITDWLPTLYAAADGDLKDLGEIDGVNQWRMLRDGYPIVRDKLLLNIDEVSKTEGAIYRQYKLLRGSFENGLYDGYYNDFERNFIPMFYFNDSKKNIQEIMPRYTETILNSAVSQGVTSFLGGPATQPSTMIQLRHEATVHCRSNATFYRDNFITCNVTECLFDIEIDPCETKNIVEQYPRIARELDKYLEHYGRNVTVQLKSPVDWLADPRRTNNTWEPWIPSGDLAFHSYNAAVQLVGLAYYFHIGIILVAAMCKAFI
ncbi:arylsulfatase B-like [Pogonomyrmex barbatus]|uniref:Arylsulfatase B-like n=1 Tax=Pogonomyrmex barbatus TaxID=144034 RepID=A0A6I9WUF7_9HYME|nr:arylsulfatase B-like [Pogonomyrmex barbatus]